MGFTNTSLWQFQGFEEEHYTQEKKGEMINNTWVSYHELEEYLDIQWERVKFMNLTWLL